MILRDTENTIVILTNTVVILKGTKVDTENNGVVLRGSEAHT